MGAQRLELGGLQPDTHIHFVPSGTAYSAINVCWRRENGKSLGTRHGFANIGNAGGRPVNAMVVRISPQGDDTSVFHALFFKTYQGVWKFGSEESKGVIIREGEILGRSSNAPALPVVSSTESSGIGFPATGTKGTPGYMFMSGGDIYFGDGSGNYYYDRYPNEGDAGVFKVGIIGSGNANDYGLVLTPVENTTPYTAGLRGVYRYFMTLMDSRRNWESRTVVISPRVDVTDPLNFVLYSIGDVPDVEAWPQQVDRVRLYRTTGWGTYLDEVRESNQWRAALVREIAVSQIAGVKQDYNADNELDFINSELLNNGAPPIPSAFAVPYNDTVLWIEPNHTLRGKQYEWSEPGSIGMVPRRILADLQANTLTGNDMPVMPRRGENVSQSHIEGPVTAVHSDASRTLLFTASAVYTVVGNSSRPIIMKVPGVPGGACTQACVSSGTLGVVAFDGQTLRLFRPGGDVVNLGEQFGIASQLVQISNPLLASVGCFDMHEQVWVCGGSNSVIYVLDYGRNKVSQFVIGGSSSSEGRIPAYMMQYPEIRKMVVVDQFGTIWAYPDGGFIDEGTYYESKYICYFGQETMGDSDLTVSRFSFRTGTIVNATTSASSVLCHLGGHFDVESGARQTSIAVTPLLAVHSNFPIALAADKLPTGRLLRFELWANSNNSRFSVHGIDRLTLDSHSRE